MPCRACPPSDGPPPSSLRSSWRAPAQPFQRSVLSTISLVGQNTARRMHRVVDEIDGLQAFLGLSMHNTPSIQRNFRARSCVR
ncbi:hypothetical protein CRENBAI_003989 [Crenichthys baileyi]|uniref:Uncharacterized protein n=1 Tax=Crenichthys baileyi TaxID=28760 RepID=A0AAV9SJF3_9TELE